MSEITDGEFEKLKHRFLMGTKTYRRYDAFLGGRARDPRTTRRTVLLLLLRRVWSWRLVCR